jgi:hypothetical protein
MPYATKLDGDNVRRTASVLSAGIDSISWVTALQPINEWASRRAPPVI